MFFNPAQHRVRQGIVNSLERFGHPRIEEIDDRLSIRFGDSEAQILFAYDKSRRSVDPIGMVVFLRTAPEEVAIMHIAVNPDYAMRDRKADSGVCMVLVEQVKEICSRIVGVRRIIFFYRQEVVIRL